MSSSIPGVVQHGDLDVDLEAIGADAGAPAAGKPAPAADHDGGGAPPEPKPKARPVSRALTPEVLDDDRALALAERVFPGREFEDGDAARASLQGVLQGNAGRAAKLAALEAETETLRHENETLKARPAPSAAPPAQGAGKGAAAPVEDDGVSAQEFVTKFMGPEKWSYFDRLRDGSALPENVKPEHADRYAFGWLTHEMDKYIVSRETALEKRVREGVLADVEKTFGERVKLAEVPAAQQRELAEGATLFYNFYNQNVDDTTGEPLFPEFGDKAATMEIARIWVDELGKKRTDEAVEAAIYRFRTRNPEWVPPAESEEEPADEGTPPGRASAGTAERGRPARPAPRGALSGTGVPGHGLPPRTRSGVDVLNDRESDARSKKVRELGFNPDRARAS